MELWAEANPHLAKQSNIRKMRKQGQITKEVADKILRANYEDRKAAIKKKASAPPVKTSQPSAKAKPAGVAPVQPASRVQQGASAVKASKKESKNTGVYGKPLPSNPQLKSQPKKSKLNPQQRRKAGQIKRRRGMSPADAAKSISDKLRLTYKKGQIVKRGGKFYKSDGKGGFTLVHSKQF